MKSKILDLKVWFLHNFEKIFEWLCVAVDGLDILLWFI